MAPSGAGRNCTQALLILRAGNFLPSRRGSPRKWGPGVRRLGAPERCSSGAVPRRSFGFFPIAGKETRPAGRNPPAARRRRNPPARNETALSSSPHPSRLRRATFPYPLCRFATSSLPLLAFGHFPLTGGIGPLTRGVGPRSPILRGPPIRRPWQSAQRRG